MKTRFFRADLAAIKQKGIMAELALATEPVAAHKQIMQGLQTGVVSELAHLVEFKPTMICQLAGINRTTYHRNRQAHNKPLSPEQSSKLYSLARVLDAALGLFEGDKSKMQAWLNKPAKALGGNKPADMLTTTTGAEAVLDLIGRIEHGVIS